MLKIDKFLFIHNLVIEKNLSNCNLNIISIKAGSIIKIKKYNDYEKTEIRPY